MLRNDKYAIARVLEYEFLASHAPEILESIFKHDYACILVIDFTFLFSRRSIFKFLRSDVFDVLSIMRADLRWGQIDLKRHRG